MNTKRAFARRFSRCLAVALLATVAALLVTGHSTVAEAAGPYYQYVAPQQCMVVVNQSPGLYWDAANEAANQNTANGIVLACPLPMDTGITYQNVSMSFWSNGYNVGTAHNSGCVGSVCALLCYHDPSGNTSCSTSAPSTSYSSGQGNVSLSFSLAGWGVNWNYVMVWLGPEFTWVNVFRGYTLSHN